MELQMQETLLKSLYGEIQGSRTLVGDGRSSEA